MARTLTATRPRDNSGHHGLITAPPEMKHGCAPLVMRTTVFLNPGHGRWVRVLPYVTPFPPSGYSIRLLTATTYPRVVMGIHLANVAERLL